MEGPLCAGACAGIVVDLTLYPLDTLKTRIQSQEGLHARGGFRSLYRGVSMALVGSAPSAALFFMSYETTRSQLHASRDLGAVSAWTLIAIDQTASVIGEAVACLIRVPIDTIKQNMQALPTASSEQPRGLCNIVSRLGNDFDPQTRKSCGPFFGLRGGVVTALYRAYPYTLYREVPFGLIQYPLYEASKRSLQGTDKEEKRWWVSGFSGFMSGAVAGGLTTPMDVVKTRLTLSLAQNSGDQRFHPQGLYRSMLHIARADGVTALFRGAGTRMLWISAGGCIFFGVYDNVLTRIQNKPSIQH